MEKQNNKNPKELYIYRIKSIAPDERFLKYQMQKDMR